MRKLLKYNDLRSYWLQPLTTPILCSILEVTIKFVGGKTTKANLGKPKGAKLKGLTPARVKVAWPPNRNLRLQNLFSFKKKMGFLFSTLFGRSSYEL